ncbi:hypothetical protein D0962_18025 [Leptolyngbyaceae cyanobacterium CCMR0082]|uniref:S-layer family protein n=1 Tax=Adonisia turfae CCMR0082 TaxID=2304604 RepID=A0A6M0S9A5_9CYAN|nr:hypothetical protein [Adonisia turfae CCMR0082]
MNTLENTQLSTLDIGGNLSIISGGGISQTTPITITGQTTLNAENQDIVLPQANDFNQLTIQGGDEVTINDINDISLEDARVFGRITVNAVTDITTQDISSLSGLIELTSRDGSIDTTGGTLSSSLSTGNGGNVSLSAGRNLNVGDIDADGLAGGNISLSAEDTISINQNRIASFTIGEGTGQGINLDADVVEVLNGGRIVSSTNGPGNAGPVVINARQLRVQGEPDQITVVTTNTTVGSSGTGGNLTVNASESIELIGNQPGEFRPDITDPLTIFEAAATPVGLTTASFGSGDAGNLKIETDRFVIRNGAGVSTSTVSGASDAGAGGEIRVSADFIDFQGRAGLATTTLGCGTAGDIFVFSDQLSLFDGAVISASSIPFSPNIGRAGDIEIEADDVLLDNRAVITTSSTTGDGGDITLGDIGVLRLLRGDGIGGIFTDGGANRAIGDGGRIFIEADNIFAVDQQNTDISATAFIGRGGGIQITTQSDPIGIEFRPNRTAFSDITAGSDQGPQGTVDIDTAGLDPTQGTANLPDEPRAPELIQGCQVSGNREATEFFDNGRGGTRPGPDEAITPETVLVPWIDLELAEDIEQDIDDNTASTSEQNEAQNNQIANCSTYSY